LNGRQSQPIDVPFVHQQDHPAAHPRAVRACILAEEQQVGLLEIVERDGANAYADGPFS
jgi:hypothetical protein